MSNKARAVVRQVAEYYYLSPADLYGRSRLQHIVTARHVAMTVLFFSSSMSMTQIAHLFSRDHTTVLHACNKIAEKARQDPRLWIDVKHLTAKARPLIKGWRQNKEHKQSQASLERMLIISGVPRES